MITKLITEKDGEQGLDEAARLLKAGELVAIPTETVYGLAANALDGNAVKNIFVAKGRPQDNPLIVHIAETDDILRLVKNLRKSILRPLVKRVVFQGSTQQISQF